MVGLMGALLQLLLIWLATKCFHAAATVATPLAVEVAVLHNFLWHERFTWPECARGMRESWRRLWRFQMGNGLISIAGNTAVTYCLIEGLKAPVALAAVLSIATCALANFFAADRWVFAFHRVKRANPECGRLKF